ncbi:MAG: hypothetical protein QG637_1844, partial [Chloroflexota bacterium]|nr:hypothetical protein [Chloroflexota bacterium]
SDDLRAKNHGKDEMLIEFYNFESEEASEKLASMGAVSLDEINGHTELLEPAPEAAEQYDLDLAPLLWAPDTGYARRNTDARNNGGLAVPLTGGLNARLTLAALAEVACNGRARLSYAIRNTDRTIGGPLAGQIALRRGSRGLAPETIVIEFHGSAGQSFGAFGITGLHLRLTGQANDYVGKGLGGGEIIIRPPEAARYVWHHNVILGNTALYGATGGELYAAGQAGERFAVRNSGARAVVEGVGDHGCEYMTGGAVVVLGKTGRNFGAGMTGGVAYVYDNHDRMTTHTNQELVCLRRVVRAEDRAELRTLLQRHLDRTGSPRACAILDDWDAQIQLFWRIAPVEQIAVLEAANEGVVAEQALP